MKPHRANLILVLGVFGLVCCGPFTSVPAWVMASGDLKEMAAGTMDPAGRETTQVGRIIAIVGTILGILSFPAGIWMVWKLWEMFSRLAAGQ
jgi:hypothetical protein